MTNELQARASLLDDLESLFEECVGGVRVGREARDRAYSRAQAVLSDVAADAPAQQIATVLFARDLFAEVAVELAARPSELQTLTRSLQSMLESSPVDLSREFLRAPQLLQLPAAVAIEVQLTLLQSFAEASATSLWRLSRAGNPEMVAYAGNPNAVSRRIRQLARRMLAGTRVDHRLASDVAGVTIDRARGRAALIISRESASGADDALLLDAAIPVFAAALERADSVVHPPPAKRGGDGGPGQTGAADRRLARIRFDLHDGPQQDVLLLAEDLRLFRSQLVSVLGGQDKGDRLLGRIDDLEARLIALDGDLRRISVSAESPFLHGETVEAALAQITDAFTERTGIEPDVRLLGDFRGLTDSQHITLLGLIREALSNIREHGDASTVTITLAASAAGVQATVTDDGRGFDPETTLVEAARHGHLGLVGMHERVRMLGGDTTIDSRPGGPTVISASLPPAPSTAPRHSRY